MKWNYFIVGILISYNTFGQTATDLDKNNGFREYTIGTHLSSFTDKILLISKKLEKDSARLYKVKEPVIIENMMGAGEVELAFYKDRLVEITLFFHQKTIDDYNNFKQSLSQLYGTPVDESNNKNKPTYLTEFDKILMWKGSVIGLQYNYDVSHKVIEIVYWGLNEVTEKSKGEF
jgi:hypothetical protein